MAFASTADVSPSLTSLAAPLLPPHTALDVNNDEVSNELPTIHKKHTPLKRSILAGYGVGHSYNDVVAACWFSYALVYYSRVAELGSVTAGVLSESNFIVFAVISC